MEKSRRGQCGGTHDAPEVTAGRQAGSALGLGLGLAVKACLQRWESCLCSPPCLVPIDEAWSAKQQQSSAPWHHGECPLHLLPKSPWLLALTAPGPRLLLENNS